MPSPRHCTLTYQDKRLNHVAVLAFDAPPPGGAPCPNATTPAVLEHVAEFAKEDPAYAGPFTFDFHPNPPDLRQYIRDNPGACDRLTAEGHKHVDYVCSLVLVQEESLVLP